MRTAISRRRLLAGGSLGILSALAGCIATGRGATETETKTYDVDGLSALSLEGVNGSVSVDGNRADAIEVRAHKAAPTEGSLESLTLETERSDGHLTIETHRDETPFLFGPDPKVDLEVTVPAGVRLARAETTNGNVDVRNATGELTAETTNGRVDVEGVDGGASAESTNGIVRVADVSGDVRAETTNGDIDVTLTDGDGDVTAESTNGEITVRAPASIDATVSIETTNGEVGVEGFDGSDGSSDGGLELTVGDGTRRIRLETENGDVTVRSDDAA
ncbi:DUF4097 family beta strand repeat-containing protein [Natrinema sp. DC36]|uniref:DUF4097 family beta strand repeat-containing protein n=1 Tax=Natrinema sp. DC36 TaxID=2878680 RepID=UPI001CF0CD4C|nr:DUF4097 family beta strand repeat-containing protein [Natrinema sp. DC36]